MITNQDKDIKFRVPDNGEVFKHFDSDSRAVREITGFRTMHGNNAVRLISHYPDGKIEDVSFHPNEEPSRVNHIIEGEFPNLKSFKHQRPSWRKYIDDPERIAMQVAVLNQCLKEYVDNFLVEPVLLKPMTFTAYDYQVHILKRSKLSQLFSNHLFVVRVTNLGKNSSILGTKESLDMHISKNGLPLRIIKRGEDWSSVSGFSTDKPPFYKKEIGLARFPEFIRALKDLLKTQIER